MFFMSSLVLSRASQKEMSFTGNGKFLHLEVTVWHLAVRTENAVFSMMAFSKLIGT